jgi:hypothetical protein
VAALATVAFLVDALQRAAPAEIVEVIAAVAGLMTAVVRAMRDRRYTQ